MDLESCTRLFAHDARRAVSRADCAAGTSRLIKIAMIRIHAALKREGLGAKMVLQVHDELVFEIPEGERSDAGALVKREMEGVASLAVPLVVSVGAGRNWIDAKG